MWDLGLRGPGLFIETIRIPGTFYFSTITKAKYVGCQKISLYPILDYPVTSPPRQTGHMSLLFWIDNHKETITKRKKKFSKCWWLWTPKEKYGRPPKNLVVKHSDLYIPYTSTHIHTRNFNQLFSNSLSNINGSKVSGKQNHETYNKIKR